MAALNQEQLQALELRRLKEENEELLENMEALNESYENAEKIQAIREPEYTALMKTCKTVSVQIKENHRLKEENKTLKKGLRSCLRMITRTLTDVKKPATPQATKCLKRKKNLQSQSAGNKKSSGIPENKRVKDDIDRSENSPDRSSDDSDSDSDSDSKQ